jgi:hypothetical protein
MSVQQFKARPPVQITVKKSPTGKRNAVEGYQRIYYEDLLSEDLLSEDLTVSA